MKSVLTRLKCIIPFIFLIKQFLPLIARRAGCESCAGYFPDQGRTFFDSWRPENAERKFILRGLSVHPGMNRKGLRVRCFSPERGLVRFSLMERRARSAGFRFLEFRGRGEACVRVPAVPRKYSGVRGNVLAISMK